MTNTRSAVQKSNTGQSMPALSGEQLQMGRDLLEYARQFARKTRSRRALLLWNRIYPGMEIKAMVTR